MASQEPFGGKIGRTISESTPWWPSDPHPPAGAPNVVLILLDDTGFSHFGCYGSDLADPGDRPARRGRTPLHQLPRDPAVLADPGRAAHRAEPPHRRDAVDLQLRHRLPPHARLDHPPRRDRGRGPPRPGLRHLRARQVAPLLDGERLGRRALRPVALPARLRPLLRVPRGRDRPVPSANWSTTTTASSRPPLPRRATT